MKGGSEPAAIPFATSPRGADGVRVLFGVGAVAVAVLEVDAKVLDRLARELGLHAGVDALGVSAEAQGFRQDLRAGRVLAERLQRPLSELLDGVGA